MVCQSNRFIAQRNIKWSWNVPKAPWMGGFYERLVQSVKRCLQRSINRAELDFVELQTILLEIELILNSRPLGPIYDENQEFLTPNHLLFGRQLNIINDCEENNTGDISNGKRVSYLKQVVDHYWKRWSKDYLTTLRNYEQSYKKDFITPSINDIVLVREDKIPRYKWKVGRICELCYSRDGRIRSVKVVVGGTRSIIKRPVNFLFPVETIK